MPLLRCTPEREREKRPPANGQLSSDRVGWTGSSLRFLSFTPEEEHPAPSSRSIEAPRPNTWGEHCECKSWWGGVLDDVRRLGTSSCSLGLSVVGVGVGNLLYSLDVLL